MCYFSANASNKVDAQAGHLLEVKRKMYGTNWLLLAGTKTVACLKPGTELEVSQLPWLARWKARIEPGTRVLFSSVRALDPAKRDRLILGDGHVIWLNELPHRLKLKVIAVPVAQAPELEPADFEEEELEEALALAGRN
jgi:hypothetical protein